MPNLSIRSGSAVKLFLGYFQCITADDSIVKKVSDCCSKSVNENNQCTCSDLGKSCKGSNDCCGEKGLTCGIDYTCIQVSFLKQNQIF